MIKSPLQKITVRGLQRITFVGKNGKPGLDAKDPTDERLISLIRPLIPLVKDGAPGHTPTTEELFALIKPLIPKVKDGHTPTNEELLSIILPLIPVVKDGKPGKDGDPGKNGSPDTGDEIIIKINKSKLKIDKSRINAIFDGGVGNRIGASTTSGKLADFINEIKFGSGLTATIDNFGVVNVSALSSPTGYNVETPSGSLYDQSAGTGGISFVVTEAPVYIVADRQTFFEGHGYSRVGLNITMDNPVAEFIRSFYL